MVFLLQTYSSNPDFNDDCDYALVDLSPKALDLTFERMGLAQAMHSDDRYFSCIEYSDYSARYISSCKELENLLSLDAIEKLNAGDIVNVGSPLVLPEDNYQRVEGDHIVVSPESVYWRCYPKHTDVRIETVSVGWRELLNYQRDLEQRGAP